MKKASSYFILYHITGIAFFICLTVLFATGGPENHTLSNTLSAGWFWVFCFVYTGIFYLNAYYLFPGLYLARKYFLYGAVLLLLLTGIIFLQPFDHIMHLSSPPPQRQPLSFNVSGGVAPAPSPAPVKDAVSIVLFFATIILSTIIPVVKQWQQASQQALQYQKDKINAELLFLKTQINPHLLFNTLNNIYALSLTGSSKTSDSILKLSEVMRYITDEAVNDLVELGKEINCIQNYVALEQLRLNNKTTLNFNAAGCNTTLKIPPLLLLPFTENIFKHGISNRESSVIDIVISTNDKSISYYSRNTVFAKAAAISRKGTGIANVRKRLDFLYKENYTLTINNDSNFFEVLLKIQTA